MACSALYRKCRYLGIWASTLAFVAVGCGDKKTNKQEAAEKKPTPATVEGLQAIPDSASAVIGIDVSALAASPIVHRALERMFARDPELKAELSGVLKACKISPESDIKSLTIALLPRGDETDSLLVTKGKYSESVITACLGRFLAESGGRLETAKEGQRSLYHQVRGDGEVDGVWLTFGSSDTVLIASTREALALSLGAGAKLDSGRTGLAQYLPRVASEDALWAVGLLTAPVAAGLVQATGEAVEAPIAIVGSAHLESGLRFRLGIEMHSAVDAKTLISQAKLQLSAAALVLQINAAGRLVQKIEFSTDKSWAQLDWQLTEQELADLMGANLSGMGSTIDKDAGNDENPPAIHDPSR